MATMRRRSFVLACTLCLAPSTLAFTTPRLPHRAATSTALSIKRRTRFLPPLHVPQSAIPPVRTFRHLLVPRQERGQFLVGLTLREGLLSLAAYLSVGALAYTRIVEHWNLVDALYFTTATFATVGYGDMSPTNDISRVFTTMFGLAGIGLLGAAIASLFSWTQRGVESVAEDGTHGQLLWKCYDRLVHDRPCEKMTLIQARSRCKTRKMPAWFSMSYYLVHRVMRSLAIILGGGLLMGYLNGGSWSWRDASYYALMTASTIGFGDLVPSTRAARLFAVVYIPLSVAAAGAILSRIALVTLQRRQRRIYHEQMEQDLTFDHLKSMDANDDGKVSREEYVAFMLQAMGRIDASDLEALHAQFRSVDVTSTGYLDDEDLRMLARLRGASVID